MKVYEMRDAGYFGRGAEAVKLRMDIRKALVLCCHF